MRKQKYVKFFTSGLNKDQQPLELEICLPIGSFELVKISNLGEYTIQSINKDAGWQVTKQTYEAIEKELYIIKCGL